MKFKVSLQAIKAPTPKMISHVGTAIASASAAAAGMNVVQGNMKIGAALAGAAFLGKFLSECFYTDDSQSNNQSNTQG